MAANKHSVELKANVQSAMFMAGGKLIQLDQDNKSYSASDANEAAGLVAVHDFLKASDRKQES